MDTQNLVYALKDGHLVCVDDVERGLACGCVCPFCGQRLIARKGRERAHHFAHQKGEECEYGYETSLHLMAKEVLSQLETMRLPAVYLHFPGSKKQRIQIAEAKEITIDHVEVERSIGNMVPDVIVYSASKKFFVEICVTHRVNIEKLRKVKAHGISLLEIDLSGRKNFIFKHDLIEIVGSGTKRKIWRYNLRAEEYYQRFCGFSDRKNIYYSKFNDGYVKRCPIKMILSDNRLKQSNANIYSDCEVCKYCIAIEHDRFVRCSGRLCIETLKDIGEMEQNGKNLERIKQEYLRLQIMKFQRLKESLCPICGRKLKQRRNARGELFLGCSGYPLHQCNYTISKQDYENIGEKEREFARILYNKYSD